MFARFKIPGTQRRRHRMTESRVTLPLGLMGIVLTVLTRADVLPFLPVRAQGYLLGASALATALGLVDLWETKRDVRRYLLSRLRVVPSPRRTSLQEDIDNGETR